MCVVGVWPQQQRVVSPFAGSRPQIEFRTTDAQTGALGFELTHTALQRCSVGIADYHDLIIGELTHVVPVAKPLRANLSQPCLRFRKSHKPLSCQATKYWR